MAEGEEEIFVEELRLLDDASGAPAVIRVGACKFLVDIWGESGLRVELIGCPASMSLGQAERQGLRASGRYRQALKELGVDEEWLERNRAWWRERTKGVGLGRVRPGARLSRVSG